MNTILLVDSDNRARRDIAVALKGLRPQWTILEADSGGQALHMASERTGDQAVDVVITEASLSDMDGFSLFDQLRSVCADAIRFTLSEDNSTEVVLENTRANHRFLVKPFDPAHLAMTIERSIRLRTVMQDEALENYMRTVKSVPALPEIHSQMMQELASPHSSLLKVGSIVERDTGLTITVLKIVNSAFYGLNRRVESVAQAVSLLGVHLIKNITLTTQVFARYEGSPLSTRRLTQLNDEALRIGAIANRFARLARVSRSTVDHCQIAGMMANVGELIATVKSFQASGEEPMSIPLIGASLLHRWLMPDAVVEAVALQHESPPRNVDLVSPLVVLHVIRYLQAHFTDTTDREQESACRDYLFEFLPEAMADAWLDAFQAIEQLTPSQPSRAA